MGESQTQPTEPANDPRSKNDQSGASGNARFNSAADTPTDKTASEKSRSEWRIALISAVSALLGALIGGVSSYLVATQSNSYQAEAALLARKQTDYSAYLSAETDLQGAAYTLRSFFERYEDSDINLLQQAADKYADAKAKAVSSDFVVALSASPDVDKVRLAIVRIQDGIDADYHTLADDSKYRQHLNPVTVQHYGSQVDQLEGLFGDFADAARADLHPKS